MGKLEIRVFGSDPPCSRCKSALAMAERVASGRPGVVVLHVNALSDEAQKYDFWMTPAIAVCEEIVFEGRIPDEEDLEEAIAKAVDGDR